jgi:hypothetical protein
LTSRAGLALQKFGIHLLNPSSRIGVLLFL